MGMSYIGPSKITRNPPDAFISFGLVFTRKSVSSPPVVVAQGMRKRCAVPLRTRWMVRSSQAPTGWPVGWEKWVSNWLGYKYIYIYIQNLCGNTLSYGYFLINVDVQCIFIYIYLYIYMYLHTYTCKYVYIHTHVVI